LCNNIDFYIAGFRHPDEKLNRNDRGDKPFRQGRGHRGRKIEDNGCQALRNNKANLPDGQQARCGGTVIGDQVRDGVLFCIKLPVGPGLGLWTQGRAQ